MTNYGTLWYETAKIYITVCLGFFVGKFGHITLNKGTCNISLNCSIAKNELPELHLFFDGLSSISMLL